MVRKAPSNDAGEKIAKEMLRLMPKLPEAS
jgi:hypothetical protein